jgi:hypothetical protein
MRAVVAAVVLVVFVAIWVIILSLYP